MTKPVATLALAAPALAALVVGGGLFRWVVAALGAAVLVDLVGMLARAAARPVLVAAAVPGVGLPVFAASTPVAGWGHAGVFVAAGLLAAFVLVLVFGRRADVLEALGATMLSALLVGLGATALVVLRALPEGATWVAALLALVAVADLAGPTLNRLRSLVSSGRGRHTPTDPWAKARTDEWESDWSELEAAADAQHRDPVFALVAPLIAVTVAAVVMVALFELPFGPPVVAAFAALALVAARGGAHLERLFAAEAGLSPGARTRIGDGLLFGVADAALLSAPAAYIVAAATI
jgi:hypothetical protein